MGIRIAGHYTDSDWRKLNLRDVGGGPDWEKAVAIVEMRIRKRFIEPIGVLVKEDRARTEAIPKERRFAEQATFGFAILALDFVLIEALQGLREGVVNHNTRSKSLVCRFLRMSPGLRDAFGSRDIAGAVYDGVRSELAHRGATSRDFTITGRDDAPLFSLVGTMKQLNRTKLHAEVNREFERMLRVLRGRNLNAAEQRSMVEWRQGVKAVFDALCA